MKVKALRDKEFKQFIHLIEFNDSIVVGSCDLPKLQPTTATIELMKDLYPSDVFECETDIEMDFELAELEVIEPDIVGADIRNKLTPPKNLVAMLKHYFDGKDVDKLKWESLIKKEMLNVENSVEYLTELF